MATTIVHLLRHGEVYNPEGILYGRIPGYHLSDLGLEMATTLAIRLHERKKDIAYIAASPLERAQETAQPLADIYGIPVDTDSRLIESENHFEGLTFSVGEGALSRPKHWPYLVNPLRPSWGESYRGQVARMADVVKSSVSRGYGREVVLVSHQLPIWVTRLSAEKKFLWHDPRRRECSLASLTSFTFQELQLINVTYSEPVADLLPENLCKAGA